VRHIADCDVVSIGSEQEQEHPGRISPRDRRPPDPGRAGTQGIITRDNVSVDVSAVAYFRVVDAVALGDASDTMMAHPLALQLRNLQSLVEIGVDKNTTVVFPAPLMSTIGELGAFLVRETSAAALGAATPPDIQELTTAVGRPNGASDTAASK
jgi:hypothetical protein